MPNLQKGFTYLEILAFGVETTIFIIFYINPYGKLHIFAPAHWNFAEANREMHLGVFEYNKAIEIYRSYRELPPGYTWLDERVRPEFPLVHAPYEVACAYKGERKQFYEECSEYFKQESINNKQQELLISNENKNEENNVSEQQNISYSLNTTRKPNIVVILLESFEPEPYGINKDVIKSRDRLEKAPLYNESYFPHFAKLANEGLELSALSSNGNPTAFGWLDFHTGLHPRRSGYNIIMDEFNDVDDINSFLTSSKYITRYISPEHLTFDNKINWVFRGSSMVRKTRMPDVIKNAPTWFHYVSFDDPSISYCEQHGLKCDNGYKFLFPDRVTLYELAHGFQRDIEVSKKLFNQKRNKEENKDTNESRMPVYATILTADTHVPYEGYDGAYFEEKMKKDIETIEFEDFISLTNYFSTTESKFLLELHNTEEYVMDAINKIKAADNHTIVVLMGDHPAKGIFNNIPDTQFNDDSGEEDIKVDKSCLNSITFNDNLFLTTGFINYLGDDPSYVQHFKDLKGQIIKVPTDHQDIVYTIEKLISPEIPSARNGRDLFTLFKQLENNERLPKHISLRSTQYHMEVATEDEIYRLNLISKTGDKHNGIEPSCLTGNERRDEIPKQAVDEFILIEELLEHLTGKNKVFHYSFRNTACVAKKTCTFPKHINTSFKEPLIRQIIEVIIGSFLTLVIIDKIVKKGQSLIFENIKFNFIRKK